MRNSLVNGSRVPALGHQEQSRLVLDELIVFLGFGQAAVFTAGASPLALPEVHDYVRVGGR
jgi:hypothetical protein